MDQQSVEVEVQRCNSLTYPFPSATCLVVRSDVRFTPEEYAAYRKTKELLGRRASGNLIVVFTMGDKLPTDGEVLGSRLHHPGTYTINKLPAHPNK